MISSGVVEGFSGKAKLTGRKAYGVENAARHRNRTVSPDGVYPTRAENIPQILLRRPFSTGNEGRLSHGPVSFDFSGVAGFSEDTEGTASIRRLGGGVGSSRCGNRAVGPGRRGRRRRGGSFGTHGSLTSGGAAWWVQR